jgi:UDP-N-acetylglucosamine--N-acetylmuramyl-(pentapeptide) pyrophosphoryl-undecaprenol N-acetylglucosamine transferase
LAETQRILLAGGGTGGHLFPAIQIASYLQQKWGASCEFVGTRKGIEYTKVPQAGFVLHTIWISGLHRRFAPANLLFPAKVIISLIQSGRILKDFQPHLVIGTGGYVSGPVLYQAVRKKIPCAIQEQNSYPGITTRLLASRVDMIFLAYKEALQYIKRVKNVFFTGNPVAVHLGTGDKAEARNYFDLEAKCKTILVFGGSQGAANINRAVDHLLQAEGIPPFQMIWQTGKKDFNYYGEKYKRLAKKHVHIFPFIDRMDLAYKTSDFAICRAGAMTISELAAFKVPAVFVPYPHAAANHQYKNARTIVQGGGGLLLEDKPDLAERIREVAIDLLRSQDQLARMREQIAQFHNNHTLQDISAHLKRLVQVDEQC